MSDTDLRLALFDYDGTLCDSASHIITTLQNAFEAEGVSAPDAAAIRAEIGAGLMPMVLPYVEHNQQKAEAIFHTYRALAIKDMESHNQDFAPLFPGAKQALEALQADGWLLGIITNKSRRGLDHGIDQHQLGGLIDISVTVDEVPAKPAPDMALTAMSRLGVMAENAVLVGDTVIDAGCARNAGISFVGVAWGYHENDALIEAGAAGLITDYADLPDLLAQLTGHTE